MRVSSSSSTSIDHVLCSQHISVSRPRVIQAVGVSDHCVQIVDFKMASPQVTVPSQFVRSVTKCCWDDVHSYLSHAPWSVLGIFDDINDMWSFFYNILQSCLDMHTCSLEEDPL